MLTRTKAVGTYGQMRIDDKSLDESKTVDLWIRATSNPPTLSQMPWSYQLDANDAVVGSFNFLHTTAWQKVATLYVGYATLITYSLGSTGTAVLDGPVDFPLALQRGSGLRTISIKVGDEYKSGVPFVKVGEEWFPSVPMVMVNSEWKETT